MRPYLTGVAGEWTKLKKVKNSCPEVQGKKTFLTSGVNVFAAS